jgi:N-methylhydantoinase B/oxoprolinase/acetone carboxylase alpha subunit
VLGGWGGSARGDGVGTFKTLIHGDARDISVENIEMTNPVIVERYEWRQESGGPRKFRGGLGIDKQQRSPGGINTSLPMSRDRRTEPTGHGEDVSQADTAAVSTNLVVVAALEIRG